MKSCHDSIHLQHPVLFQVQDEPDVPKANDSGLCERCGVLGQRLDPSEVRDFRNPYQA